MAEHSPEVEHARASALAAMGSIDAQTNAGPLDPFRSLVAWIVQAKDTLGMETAILAAESAWDFVSKYDFPQIPNAIEVPLKAWLRGQIRPLIERLYMGS